MMEVLYLMEAGYPTRCPFSLITERCMPPLLIFFTVGVI